ncbi:MAG: MarR family transcriptional regulator [Proteobacteria bacterium]|nr:MAG: MarR family transcriptional regulator [Pseudomonadota bacterium]
MRNAPIVGTIYLLKSAELAVRSCMEAALVDYGLTSTQFLMLFRLRDRSETSAAALAREMGVRPQSLVEVIAVLERKGLIKRSASPTHGRILHIQLTPAGRKLLAETLRVAGRIEADVLADLDGRQVLALQDALTAIWQRAERHELHSASQRTKRTSTKRTGAKRRPRNRTNP